MEEDLPVSLPREKEKQAIFSNIDFKWIVALLVTLLVGVYMYGSGAFVNISKNTWLGLGGLIIGLFYLLFSKIRPRQPIGMKMARMIAKAWILDLQKDKEVIEGNVRLPPKDKRIKNRGKITDYIITADIVPKQGKIQTVIVGVDAYSGDCMKLDEKIAGVVSIDDEAKDIAPMPVVVKRGMTPETVYTEEEED